MKHKVDIEAVCPYCGAIVETYDSLPIETMICDGCDNEFDIEYDIEVFNVVASKKD